MTAILIAIYKIFRACMKFEVHFYLTRDMTVRAWYHNFILHPTRLQAYTAVPTGWFVQQKI